MNRQIFYTFLFFVLPLIYFFSLPIETGDLAIWVAHGKVCLATGKILRHDVFSFLSTVDLVYPVATSILYAWIYKFYDLIGVSIFHKVCLFLILLIWFNNFKNEKNFNWNIEIILAVSLSLFGASLFFTDRPALLAMVPFVLSYKILQKKIELTKWDILKLLLINILWVNIHGSWPILLLMFIYRFLMRLFFKNSKENWKNIIAIFLILLSSLINPFTSKIFIYVYETIMISKARQISEWSLTIPQGTFVTQVWLFYLLTFVYFYLLIKSLKHSKEKLIFTISSPFLLLLFLGFQSVRNTAWSFFVFPVFLIENQFVHFQHNQKNYTDKYKLNFFIASIAAVFLIAFFPSIKPFTARFLPKSKSAVFALNTPIKFSEYLNKTDDIYPLFNEWELGSYLILKQKHPVFIDSRNIIFRSKDFNNYNDIISAKYSWEILVNQYNIHYILIEKILNNVLYSELLKNKNWKNVLEDDQLILFKKQ